MTNILTLSLIIIWIKLLCLFKLLQNFQNCSEQSAFDAQKHDAISFGCKANGLAICQGLSYQGAIVKPQIVQSAAEI